MLNTIKRRIPPRLRNAIKLSLSLLTRELAYLESHLTDHCNLNCKGCLHYSSIAPEWYADLEQFEKDMRRLSQLFRSIKTIRIMGGEPLLHPNADRFIRIARSAFPKSNLRFVTNGILLAQATQAFWDSCRETKTTIDWIVYPPMVKYFDDYCALCDSQDVMLSAEHVDIFRAKYNPKGDSDKKLAFTHCYIGTRAQCRFLQNGRLYTCAMPSLAHYFNDRFGCSIATDEGIDIHSKFTSGRKAIRQLSKPIETCKWCTLEWPSFKWKAGSSAFVNDWDMEAQKTVPEQLNSGDSV